MKEQIKEQKNRIILILFVIASLLFAIPSIFYYIKNHTVLDFDEQFQFLLKNNQTDFLQGIIYLIVLSFLVICFYLVIKNRTKIFKNTKKMFLYITLISIIFGIVIPFTSSDIFYYIGVGSIDGKYGQNPYYTSIKEFVETADNTKYLEQDTALLKGYNNYWSGTTVVYGPVWTLICKTVRNIIFWKY